jgi:IS5 family transposase
MRFQPGALDLALSASERDDQDRQDAGGMGAAAAKNAQKDKDARWTKKNDASVFGYKNHLGVDKARKLIRKWDAPAAAVHDSQKLDDVLDLSNTGKGHRPSPARDSV